MVLVGTATFRHLPLYFFSRQWVSTTHLEIYFDIEYAKQEVATLTEAFVFYTSQGARTISSITLNNLPTISFSELQHLFSILRATAIDVYTPLSVEGQENSPNIPVPPLLPCGGLLTYVDICLSPDPSQATLYWIKWLTGACGSLIELRLSSHSPHAAFPLQVLAYVASTSLVHLKLRGSGELTQHYHKHFRHILKKN
jgi:hypothetical protein